MNAAPTTVSSADPQAALDGLIVRALRTALGDLCPENPLALLTPARDAKFGDFQSNCAMPLAKQLRDPLKEQLSVTNPRELAQRVVDALAADGAFTAIAESPQIAGPGFVNITLKADAITSALRALDTDDLGLPKPQSKGEAPRNVVVDLCGVNLAKQMHVGHLRATVIGDALARLHERVGDNVTRQNHFGDWGLPIAMVTRAVRDRADAGTLDLATLSLEHLEQLYREAQSEAAPDRRGLSAVEKFDLGPKAAAELEEQVAGAMEELTAAKETLVKLQSGDEETVKIWREISRVTLDACFANCATLGANVTNEHTAGESSYATDLAEVVADLEARNIAEESEGALIVRVDEQAGIKEPLIVRKSDGGFLYATTDLAAIRRRVHKLHASRIIYAVDARQSLHFKQAFAGATRAGYATLPEGDCKGETATLIHAAFGTVLGEDSRPFKTRSGDNVKLADLLAEAIDRADKAVAEKNPDLPEDERLEVAKAVGIGAIKYADLSTERIKDYVFSFDRMLAFEGNTGPYLQYAAVRVASIFRKAKDTLGIDEASLTGDFAVSAPEEKAIALKLLQYPGAVRAAAESCEPHRLCAYIYELASAFSTFFAACPVLGADDETTRDARLKLCSLTGRVLRDGLNTLGLVPLERM